MEPLAQNVLYMICEHISRVATKVTDPRSKHEFTRDHLNSYLTSYISLVLYNNHKYENVGFNKTLCAAMLDDLAFNKDSYFSKTIKYENLKD
jgi:hypothetical protein